MRGGLLSQLVGLHLFCFAYCWSRFLGLAIKASHCFWVLTISTPFLGWVGVSSPGEKLKNLKSVMSVLSRFYKNDIPPMFDFSVVALVTRRASCYHGKYHLREAYTSKFSQPQITLLQVSTYVQIFTKFLHRNKPHCVLFRCLSLSNLCRFFWILCSRRKKGAI